MITLRKSYTRLKDYFVLSLHILIDSLQNKEIHLIINPLDVQ